MVGHYSLPLSKHLNIVIKLLRTVISPASLRGWLGTIPSHKAISLNIVNKLLKTVISPAGVWGWLGNGREPLLQAIHLSPSDHQLVESSVYDQTKSLPLIFKAELHKVFASGWSLPLLITPLQVMRVPASRKMECKGEFDTQRAKKMLQKIRHAELL